MPSDILYHIDFLGSTHIFKKIAKFAKFTDSKKGALPYYSVHEACIACFVRNPGCRYKYLTIV